EEDGAVGVVDGLGEGLAEDGPILLDVEGPRYAHHGEGLGDLAVVAGAGEGLLVDVVQEVADAGDDGVGGVAEGAAVGDAVLGEGAQGGLEALGLLDQQFGGGERRVDGAVQDEGADVLGELLGVEGSEVGAVGGAVVGELVVAQGGAEDVHVAGGVDGAHVGELVRGLGLAVLGELLAFRSEGAGLLLVVRGGVGGEEVVELGAGVAADGVAAGDAAGVEADDVEALAEVGAEGTADLADEVDAGAAGSARVGEQRADPVGGVLGREPDDGDAELVAGRLGVVQRHLDGGALEAVLAVLPGGLLLVERFEARGDGGGARRVLVAVAAGRGERQRRGHADVLHCPHWSPSRRRASYAAAYATSTRWPVSLSVVPLSDPSGYLPAPDGTSADGVIPIALAVRVLPPFPTVP